MRKLLYAGFGLVVLGLLNFGVVQKEQVLREGHGLYLKLQPVDPRSLLQGDFMRLGFEVETELRSALKNKPIRAGGVVVNKGADGVGNYVRIDDGRELATNEYWLHFTNVSWRPNLVPNSFFFQEGEASAFESAEYALFVYDASRKDYVLRGLADENKELINPRSTLGF